MEAIFSREVKFISPLGEKKKANWKGILPLSFSETQILSRTFHKERFFQKVL